MCNSWVWLFWQKGNLSSPRVVQHRSVPASQRLFCLTYLFVTRALVFCGPELNCPCKGAFASFTLRCALS